MIKIKLKNGKKKNKKQLNSLIKYQLKFSYMKIAQKLEFKHQKNKLFKVFLTDLLIYQKKHRENGLMTYKNKKKQLIKI